MRFYSASVDTARCTARMELTVTVLTHADVMWQNCRWSVGELKISVALLVLLLLLSSVSKKHQSSHDRRYDLSTANVLPVAFAMTALKINVLLGSLTFVGSSSVRAMNFECRNIGIHFTRPIGSFAARSEARCIGHSSSLVRSRFNDCISRLTQPRKGRQTRRDRKSVV